MQIATKQFKDKIVGAEKEMTFQIDQDNPIIFEILRNKMYSNKIGSLCREVASNSRDANREAGNGDLPIEIEIIEPNQLVFLGDMSICFRDNGIGITPARMEDVFIKYASSTKRDSNAQTGGFGLGAKTPFAYTDTFTIVTVCDYAEPILACNVEHRTIEIVGHLPSQRRKYIYTAMIDSSQKGKMVLFDSEEADDLNTGTEIIVPIKEEDRNRFESEVNNATYLWGDDQVIYKNFNQETPELKVIFGDDEFNVSENNFTNDAYILNIDGIAYPLDLNQIDTSLIGKNGVGDYHSIILNFNVGELTISANREAVQYDKETTKIIRSKLVTMYKALRRKLRSYIEGSTSFHEAVSNKNNIFDNRYSHAYESIESIYSKSVKNNGLFTNRKFSPFYWNNRLVTDSLTLKGHTIVKVFFDKYSGKNKYEDLGNKTSFRGDIAQQLYYSDTKKDSRRNQTLFNQDVKSFYLLMPSGNKKAEQAQDLMTLLFDYEIDVKQYSNVEKVKSENVTKTDNTYVRGETVEVKLREFCYGHHWESHSVELNRKTNEPTVNIKDALFHIVEESLTQLNFNKIRYNDKSAIKADFAKNVMKRDVYGITRAKYDRYFSNSKKLNEAVDDYVKNNVTTITMKAQDKAFKTVLQSTNHIIVSAFPELLCQSLQDYIGTGTLDDVFKEKTTSFSDWDTILGEDWQKKDFEDMEEKSIRNIERHYPLLSSVLQQHSASYSYHRKMTKPNQINKYNRIVRNIKNYIELVDKSITK